MILLPFQISDAFAFPIPAKHLAKFSKSDIDTIRSIVKTLRGALVLALSRFSGSSDALVGNGFVTDFTPNGRSIKRESWFCLSNPSLPVPVLYFAVIFSTPINGLEPLLPSPKMIIVLPSSSFLVTKTRSFGLAP